MIKFKGQRGAEETNKRLQRKRENNKCLYKTSRNQTKQNNRGTTKNSIKRIPSLRST